ncbi:MAG: electron transfer flavoprotein subunit alpha/FixB family protein [Oligoflexales bacterium]|nr:electron transfer flavoprotein subunit alpha/FixB family protein [Oligoflexales bacterium]
MKVLVFLEQREGKLKSSALEALTTASKISGGQAANVAGLIVGNQVEGLVSEVKGYGADSVFVAQSAEFEKFNVLEYAAATKAAIDEFKPDVVLGIASPMGRDLFPRVAARCNAGLITDLVDLDLDGGFSGGTKPMYAGKVLAKIAFQGDGIKFATLRPNVFPSEESSGNAEAKALNVSPIQDQNLKLAEIRKGKSDKQDLTEATRIISGGRAMGNADNFKVLHDCAEVVSATVGASRAAVDSGYAGHDMQVGQTGKTVNPSLYVACGISGSIQHMAGMRTSKVIVAINTDPDAPIFSIADYGIVADLFEAVPILTDKFKEILS